MSQTWREVADAVIRAVDQDLPLDADFRAVVMALRKAYPFGARGGWPNDAWTSARREYLLRRFPREYGADLRRRRRAAGFAFPTDQQDGGLFGEETS